MGACLEKEGNQFMKKKYAWLFTLIFLVVLLVPGMVYAAGEGAQTSEAETLPPAEAPETAKPESAGQKPEADPRAALKEALEKSSLMADVVIADGVYIDEIAVGGMTAEEALEAVLSQIEGFGKNMRV